MSHIIRNGKGKHNPCSARCTGASRLHAEFETCAGTTPAPQIVVHKSQTEWRFGIEQLQTTSRGDLLVEECEDRPGPVVIVLQDLFLLAPDCQLAVINLVGRLEAVQNRSSTDAQTTFFGTVPLEFIGRNARLRDPFLAVLDALPDGLQLDAQWLAKKTLVAAARQWQQSNCGDAARAIQRRFEEHGFDKPSFHDLRRAIERCEDESVDPESEPMQVTSAIPGAPVPDDLEVPPGWTLSEQGIAAPGEGSATILAPLLLSGRLKNLGDDAEFVELTWLRDSKWSSRIVKRAVVATAREIVSLATYGLPVTSNNAADVVQFLDEFQAQNLEQLPLSLASNRLGWTDRDLGVFLCGGELLAAESETAATSSIRFVGADAGDVQVADAFQQGGSLEDWRYAIATVEFHPGVRLAVLASLAAPLLEILGASNFCVDFCGETSCGKTTTLKIAASVWGRPSQREQAGVMSTWDATRVSIERRSALLHNLPLILDDTKRAADPRHIAQVVYDVASGRGRDRGSVQGIAPTGTWSTVLISSGEAPLSSHTGDGGTRARILSLWGSPFDGTTTTTANAVQSISKLIEHNYGHAGCAFVKWLIENRVAWGAILEGFAELKEHFLERAAGNAIAGRLAEHIAVLALTEQLASQAGIIEWADLCTLGHLFARLTSDVAEGDRATAALSHVVSWAHAHVDEFHSNPPHPGPARRFPPNGQAGRWDQHPSWAYLAFYPHRLDEVLRAGGFEPPAVLRTWRDRGWLQTNPGRKKYRVRTTGPQPKVMIAIRRSAIEEVENMENGQDDDAGVHEV